MQDSIIGQFIIIETLNKKIFKGRIYTFDLHLDTVVLQTTSSFSPTTPNKTFDLHIIKISHILQLIKDDNENLDPLVQIRLPSLNEILAREESSLQSARLLELTRGKGVSNEGQLLFDALSKTMKVSWLGKSIVVMESIIINDPYTDCETKETSVNSVFFERVKKVLAGERLKLGL